jgi:hypothetical protein
VAKPIDAQKIANDAALLRRVLPDQIVDDHNQNGRKRPSSAAFKQVDMSVDCEPILQEYGLDWKFTLEGYPGVSLVRFPASLPRSLGLEVEHRPLVHNPAHSVVPGRRTDGQARSMARSSETQWVFSAWLDTKS